MRVHAGCRAAKAVGALGALGGLHTAVNTAGGGPAKRTITMEGPHPLAEFRLDAGGAGRWPTRRRGRSDRGRE
ncbi:hypothetical protein ND748_23800 [Frankia sp. AiPs1]|uniref:hypothetical protein n=1 Tax=Frankia sp. AiPs1 TaxID=573493 RepID=UPI002042F383|nr:hypothetical protein [Frankia sp. AiPs1]MCM3924676.1 hypothetical protein [Frankia sp. AiPs1]